MVEIILNLAVATSEKSGSRTSTFRFKIPLDGYSTVAFLIASKSTELWPFND